MVGDVVQRRQQESLAEARFVAADNGLAAAKYLGL